MAEIFSESPEGICVYCNRTPGKDGKAKNSTVVALFVFFLVSGFCFAYFRFFSLSLSSFDHRVSSFLLLAMFAMSIIGALEAFASHFHHFLFSVGTGELFKVTVFHRKRMASFDEIHDVVVQEHFTPWRAACVATWRIDRMRVPLLLSVFCKDASDLWVYEQRVIPAIRRVMADYRSNVSPTEQSAEPLAGSVCQAMPTGQWGTARLFSLEGTAYVMRRRIEPPLLFAVSLAIGAWWLAVPHGGFVGILLGIGTFAAFLAFICEDDKMVIEPEEGRISIFSCFGLWKQIYIVDSFNCFSIFSFGPLHFLLLRLHGRWQPVQLAVTFSRKRLEPALLETAAILSVDGFDRLSG